MQCTVPIKVCTACTVLLYFCDRLTSKAPPVGKVYVHGQPCDGIHIGVSFSNVNVRVSSNALYYHNSNKKDISNLQNPRYSDMLVYLIRKHIVLPKFYVNPVTSAAFTHISVSEPSIALGTFMTLRKVVLLYDLLIHTLNR